MFFRIGVFKNLTNFTGKYMCWSLFNKLADLKAYNFTKKRLQHTCFSVKFAKFLRTPSVAASEFSETKFKLSYSTSGENKISEYFLTVGHEH